MINYCEQREDHYSSQEDNYKQREDHYGSQKDHNEQREDHYNPQKNASHVPWLWTYQCFQSYNSPETKVMFSFS